MLRVVSLNLNGIRAAYRKGVADWLVAIKPDIVCVQEIRAQQQDLTDDLRRLAGMTGHFSFAKKRGYSGVGIYTKRCPNKVKYSFNDTAIDSEGRFIRLDYPRYSIVSLYLPSGSSGEERQNFKYRMMTLTRKKFNGYLRTAKNTGRDFLLCGDFNIAHTKKDIRNWRTNQKQSGFLPEERAWFDQLTQKWKDTFRLLNNNDGEYTWWSNRGRAWDNNVGWRIDYQLATANLAGKAMRATIYKETRFSDHAPLIIDYKTA